MTQCSPNTDAVFCFLRVLKGVVCVCRTSGNERPGSCEQRRSAGPDSTAGCSIPSAAPGQPGYDWACAWPGNQKDMHDYTTSR